MNVYEKAIQFLVLAALEANGLTADIRVVKADAGEDPVTNSYSTKEEHLQCGKSNQISTNWPEQAPA